MCQSATLLRIRAARMAPRPVGRHLNPIALPYVGNDVGREGSPLDALKSPLFHNETLSPFRGVTQGTYTYASERYSCVRVQQSLDSALLSVEGGMSHTEHFRVTLVSRMHTRFGRTAPWLM